MKEGTKDLVELTTNHEGQYTRTIDTYKEFKKPERKQRTRSRNMTVVRVKETEAENCKHKNNA